MKTALSLTGMFFLAAVFCTLPINALGQEEAPPNRQKSSKDRLNAFTQRQPTSLAVRWF